MGPTKAEQKRAKALASFLKGAGRDHLIVYYDIDMENRIYADVNHQLDRPEGLVSILIELAKTDGKIANLLMHIHQEVEKKRTDIRKNGIRK